MGRAGQGKRTQQYNPGARTLREYTEAALQHVRDALDADGKVFHETPKEKRQEFVTEIWPRRARTAPTAAS